jgi:hypothetical protein
VVGGDELHAGVVKVEGRVGVVGDDDADGNKGVANVGEAEEVAVARFSAGVDGDGDVLLGVGVDGDIFAGGAGGWGLFTPCVDGQRKGASEENKQK